MTTTLTLTVGETAAALAGLRAKNTPSARAAGRALIRHLRDSFPGRTFAPGPASAIRLFEAAAAPLEKLDRVHAERRRLERKLESTRAEVASLRKARCEGVVDSAIRRGIVSRHERDSLVRALEAGDVNLRSALDPLYAPPAPSDEEFARQFEATYREAPVVPAPPRTTEDAVRRQIAADLGIPVEEVI